MNAEQTTSITWDAYEHNHGERGSDWFWMLGIGALAVTVASILLGNVLFGVLVLVAAFVVALVAARPVRIVSYAVTTRGLRIDDLLYPYSSLESFALTEEHPEGPQLLIKSSRLFMPLLVIPVPEEYVDEIEDVVAARLPEAHLEEPFFHQVLDFFGF